jgi:amphi-Trp domain-containing protein
MSDDTPSTADADETTDAEPEPERTLIRQGRDFEQEYRLSAEEAGRFLVKVGEALQSGDELTLQTDEWELPFPFGEPVELEVDFDGVGEPELEIEVEIPGRTDEDAPDVV